MFSCCMDWIKKKKTMKISFVAGDIFMKYEPEGTEIVQVHI